MQELEIAINHPTGLHARPAAMFVQAAKGFASAIKVKHCGREADAKSIMGVMSLGIKDNTTITITADGADEQQAVSKLADFIKTELAGS